MESFPSGPVTNYGITLLTEGFEPNITYVSPDNDMTFYLNGGLAPWPGVTEGVVLADGIDGMHPTFNHLDHRGARQDGATYVDTVYDPAEMNLMVNLTARTPEGLRAVIRKWVAAWDPERAGTLSWVTPDGGEWWCHPRLFRPPPEKMERSMARSRQQKFTWAIRNDDAFWRSHDSVSQFQIPFLTARDSFTRNDVGTLGPNWAQTYSGTGAGVCETDGTRARWTPAGIGSRTVVNRWLGLDEIQTVTVNGSPTTWRLSYAGQPTAPIAHPATASLVQTRLEGLGNIDTGDVSVAGPTGGPYQVTFTGALAKQNVAEMAGTVLSGGTNPFVQVAKTQDGAPAVTATDNQVVKFRLSNFYQWPFPTGAHLDIWCRMNTAGDSGVRLRISGQSVTVSRFNAGVETVLYDRFLLLTPLWHEEWAFIAGASSNSRRFKVTRSGFPIVDFTERTAGSLVGPLYRGSGFGMGAGANPAHQDAPPTIFEWSADDNTAVTATGELPLTNFGDQKGWPDLVVYGPGTFFFGDGPGVEPTIEFGPLEAGQVALIKTHPGERGVYDITADHSDQDLPFFQSFLKSLLNFAFNNNVPPLLNWFESFFGIPPPQGNLYAELKGRWSKPFPPKPVGTLPVTSVLSVKVVDGTADSKVVAALTPLKRWPE